MIEGAEDHGIHVKEFSRFASPNPDQMLLSPVGRQASTQTKRSGVIVKGGEAHQSLPLAQHVVEQGRKRPVLSLGRLKCFTDDGHLCFRELCGVESATNI